MNEEKIIPTAVPVSAGISVTTDAIGPLEDEEIYCPICTYNLTGTFSGRCPECGSMFHREALIEAQKSNKLSLIPWDSPKPMPFVRRFWATLKISLFDPKQFAVVFSVQPQHSRVLGFFLMVFLLVCLIALAFFGAAAVLVPNFLRTGSRDRLLFVGGVVLYAMMLIFGSTLSSAIVLWVTSPHYDGRRHFRPWLSICAYSSCHYLLMGVVAPLCWLTMLISRPVGIICFWLAAVGCGALAGFTLQAVMEHRTAKHQRSMFCALLLIGVYVIWPFVSYGMIMAIISLVYLFLL